MKDEDIRLNLIFSIHDITGYLDDGSSTKVISGEENFCKEKLKMVDILEPGVSRTMISQ